MNLRGRIAVAAWDALVSLTPGSLAIYGMRCGPSNVWQRLAGRIFLSSWWPYGNESEGSP